MAWFDVLPHACGAWCMMHNALIKIKKTNRTPPVLLWHKRYSMVHRTLAAASCLSRESNTAADLHNQSQSHGAPLAPTQAHMQLHAQSIPLTQLCISSVQQPTSAAGPPLYVWLPKPLPPAVFKAWAETGVAVFSYDAHGMGASEPKAPGERYLVQSMKHLVRRKQWQGVDGIKSMGT